MEQLKKIIKNAFITSLVVLVYGILTKSELLYIGVFLGCLVSVLGFYMTIIDAQNSIYSKSPMKSSVIGYLKRYMVYGIFLTIATKYYGLPMLISSAIGLLNIKFNIWIITLSENIKKFKEKHLS